MYGLVRRTVSREGKQVDQEEAGWLEGLISTRPGFETNVVTTSAGLTQDSSAGFDDGGWLRLGGTSYPLVFGMPSHAAQTARPFLELARARREIERCKWRAIMAICAEWLKRRTRLPLPLATQLYLSSPVSISVYE